MHDRERGGLIWKSHCRARVVCVGMESDEEIRRVPEVGLELATGPSTSGRETGGAGAAAAAAAGTSSDRGQSSSAVGQAASGARRSGRSPADKEHRRLKRCVSYTTPLP